MSLNGAMSREVAHEDRISKSGSPFIKKQRKA